LDVFSGYFEFYRTIKGNFTRAKYRGFFPIFNRHSEQIVKVIIIRSFMLLHILDGEFDPPPSPNIHTLLPSGIAVIGIDLWVERFTRLFNQVAGNKEVL
jgi:hypothetical protein